MRLTAQSVALGLLLFAVTAIAKEPAVVDESIEGHAAEQKRAAHNSQLWRHPELKQIADAEIASGRLQPLLLRVLLPLFPPSTSPKRLASKTDIGRSISCSAGLCTAQP